MIRVVKAADLCIFNRFNDHYPKGMFKKKKKNIIITLTSKVNIFVILLKSTNYCC